MNRLLFILGVFCVASLVLFGLYFFFLRSPSSTGPTDTIPTTQPIQNPYTGATQKKVSPSEFTTIFYQWYLQGLAKGPAFSSSQEFTSSLSQWLTPSFISSLGALTDNTDSDPVLLAQDYQNSWYTHLSPQIIEQTETTSTVRLTLGMEADEHVVVVHLELTDGQWRISAVTQAA